MLAGIEHEIDRAGRFGQRPEDLVYNAAKAGKVVYRTKNDDLLISYWSLVFDYSKGIVCLLANKFHSPAFALMRPLVEAVTREHIVLVGSEDEVKKIRSDRFKVNYNKDGARIDKILGSGSLFQGFLKDSRDMLYSLTHSGTAQLQNRWEGDALGSGFSDVRILALLATCSIAVFMTTILVTRHFGLDEQREAAEAAFLEFGSPVPVISPPIPGPSPRAP
jgi:hypothetical protein